MEDPGDCLRAGVLRPRRGLRALAWLAAALALPAALHGERPASWPPPTLQATGLYADWTNKTVAPANLPFSPQYPLWSDGAVKRRWMHIPRGRYIDASNPDAWQFPVGTRLWKEFRFSRRAETRYIERTRAGWRFATYAWNEDETEAPLAPELGVRRSVLVREGVHHAIPSQSDCRACHEAGPVVVLGVSSLQLSPDRDPNAPHAEVPPPGAVDLRSLVSRGLVRNLPARILQQPPAIVASSATERAALGYLHGNCGGCHTGTGELASLAFALNYTLTRSPGTPPPALATTLRQPARFKLPGSTDALERIVPQRPDLSLIVARMSSRHPLVQMPPLGTSIVDEDAVRLITRWIAEDLPSAEPTVTRREEHR